MADRLAVLLERFSINAQVLQAGVPAANDGTLRDSDVGHLHLVRHGAVTVEHGDTRLRIEVPSLLLYPRAMAHRFVADAPGEADIASVQLQFDGGAGNPIRNALPDVVCLPLDAIWGAAPVLALLFEEVHDNRCGRHALVNRLFDVLMIQVLRQLMESGDVQVGLLGGLGHPRLRHALVAMHEAPAQPWTLESLAATAGMSRSVFAGSFRDALGATPGHYLQGWRVGLAQQAMRDGRPLKMIAAEVGYGSEAALSRAFKAHCGQSPRDWRRGDAALRVSAHVG